MANPTHLYANAGSFTATLEVTGNGGAKSQATVDVAVSVPANPPPTATASATPTSGKAPLLVTFTGGGSDPGGSIATYAWMFGDGGSSTQQNPTHTYQTSGNFTATLTVTDNGGATGSSSVAIAANSAGNQPPTASATATPTSGKAPLVVTFSGSGVDSDGTIASYALTVGAQRFTRANFGVRLRGTHFSNLQSKGDLYALSTDVTVASGVHFTFAGGRLDELNVNPALDRHLSWYGLDMDAAIGQHWSILLSLERDSGTFEDQDRIYAGVMYRF